jgi:hypothetical protein
MPSLMGTRARQAATIQRARRLALQVITALDELRALSQARNNGAVGVDPSNNPADPQSFLDSTAQALGFVTAQIASDTFSTALSAADTLTQSTDYQALQQLSAYYEIDEC